MGTSCDIHEILMQGQIGNHVGPTLNRVHGIADPLLRGPHNWRRDVIGVLSECSGYRPRESCALLLIKAFRSRARKLPRDLADLSDKRASGGLRGTDMDIFSCGDAEQSLRIDILCWTQ